MYTIRVNARSRILEVQIEGQLAPEEAIRAVQQSFALSDAGQLARCRCDVTGVRERRAFAVLGEALRGRLRPGQRVAIVCSSAQLRRLRGLARVARLDDRVGLFTREADASDWLASATSGRLSETAMRHFAATATGAKKVASRANRGAA